MSTQRISILQKKCRGFILDGLVFLEKALGLLAMSSLMRSFGYLPPIFIYTNLNEGTISVCMHALVRLETLKVRISSSAQATWLLFPRGWL